VTTVGLSRAAQTVSSGSVLKGRGHEGARLIIAAFSAHDPNSNRRCGSIAAEQVIHAPPAFRRSTSWKIMKFQHIGIPTTGSFAGEIPLPHLKITVSDHQNNPFGIQWQRYWEDAPYPDLVKTVPHVAFEVDDLAAAISGYKVIIEPNSPSKGVLVAFIEVNGAPVELLQVDHALRPDL
jgi:hypothetical protein